MDSSKDDAKLTALLEELRPTPREQFAAELDQRAAAGFPRRSRLAALRERLRTTPPRKVLLPVGAAATTILVLGAVIVGTNFGGGSSDDMVMQELSLDAGGAESAAPPASSAPPTEIKPFSRELESFDGSGSYTSGSDRLTHKGAAADSPKRSIEQSARITIGTAPDEVGDAAAEVFDVVHANQGIVQRSSVNEDADEASASFDLLIPSGKLGDALASFSAIGEVLSRNEATADITAPTVGAAERLQDSRARIDSLLGQLAASTGEAERETVEAELRAERRRAARLRARLAGLKRRANLSRVALRIESTAGSSQGSWGVGDAFHDAGRLLAGAAAVAIVTLAVLAPIALLVLLAWLAHRAWLRRARTRTLG
jgi:hypothetical protein